MSADLNKPVLVTPSGAKGGAVIAGTGSDIVAHTLVSGTDQMDAVTIECWNTTAGALTATVKWPTTTGGTASLTTSLSAGNAGAIPLCERWTGNGGGDVIVNGAAGLNFKIGVERYAAGDGSK